MKNELRYPEAQCDMSVSISSESDLRISVEKLREILESHFTHRILPSEIDEIINEVKKEI